MDLNSDGVVDFEEFLGMFRAKWAMTDGGFMVRPKWQVRPCGRGSLEGQPVVGGWVDQSVGGRRVVDRSVGG